MKNVKTHVSAVQNQHDEQNFINKKANISDECMFTYTGPSLFLDLRRSA